MTYKLTFPKSDGTAATEELNIEGALVVIGANGTGKSRLGHWLENKTHDGKKAKRISAQRLLNFGEAQPQNLTQAKSSYDGQKYNVEQAANDFQQLLNLLYAKERQRDAEYVEQGRQDGGTSEPPPSSEIDTIIEIWKSLFPSREIEMSDGKVNVKNQGPAYVGNQMSDGEKVAFYLIGHTLCAETDSIIIVDEPELHLHKSLMSGLWRKLQELRPDCSFIYITHDLDFASLISDSKRIWLKEYPASNQWQWEDITKISLDFPEPMVLEILGNRKPVLFVEGEVGKADHLLYQEIYPDLFVRPMGNCRQVIEATGILRRHPTFHHLKIYGLVDKDFMTDEEITALEKKGVKAIDFAEIENLLCLPEVIEVLAEHQNLDVESKKQEIEQFILAEFENQKELQLARKLAREVRFLYSQFSINHRTIATLEAEIEELKNKIPTQKERIHRKANNAFNKAVASKDMDTVLRHMKRRGLYAQIARKLNIKPKEYKNLIHRKLKNDKEAKSKILPILQAHLPTFQTQ